MKNMIIILAVMVLVIQLIGISVCCYMLDQAPQEDVQAVATVEKVSVNEEFATIKEVIERQNMEIDRLEEEFANLGYERAELKEQLNSEAESENILGLDTADQVLIIVISVLLIGIAVGELMSPPMHKRFDSGHPWNWL